MCRIRSRVRPRNRNSQKFFCMSRLSPGPNRFTYRMKVNHDQVRVKYEQSRSGKIRPISSSTSMSIIKSRFCSTQNYRSWLSPGSGPVPDLGSNSDISSGTGLKQTLCSGPSQVRSGQVRSGLVRSDHLT